MDNKILIGSAIGLIVIIGALFALNKISKAPEYSDKLKVTTSFYPLYYFSQQIGGTKADVANITPSGAEPHDYEPTAKDIARIEDSKLLVINGGGLEAWADNVTHNIDSKNTLVVVAGQNLTNQEITEEGKKITDPHVWLSPSLAKKMVDTITQGLITADSGNKEYYQNNANTLKASLDALDAQYKQGLSSCKEKNIITSHAAFGYLASNYGLVQVSIAGLSPDAEPSSQQLADITAFVKNHHIHYIFFESLVSPKLSETIAQETGAKTLVLNPLEGLTPKEVSQGKNYVTIMQENLANLKTALQCR
jgi:zinc transport system substrate-binding protein